ncbi:amidohydrolase [Candidatus Latescibacterota bacterium]
MYGFRTFFAVCLCVFIPAAGFAGNSMDDYKHEAIEWIEAHHEMFEVAALSIHGFAETALTEYRSAEYLAGMLETEGFTVERGVAAMPTAFVATFGSGHPIIGILAEYDALPGLSQKPGITNKEPVREGEPGHGCGHNLFGSGSSAAAMAIKSVMKEHSLAGTVKLFGCPAEETVVGKVYMARDGVFDGLDVCLTWHPSEKNRVNLGSTLAMNNFEVVFRGKTAHGAADPWNGRSALDAVELMNSGVNYLREHVKETVRIHYIIPDGGTAPNIVPDYARVWYFVRDARREGVDEVYERVLKCAEGAALMTGTTMEVNLITGVYEYLPNHVLSSVVDRNFRMIGTPQFSGEEQAFAREMQRNLEIEEKGLKTEIEEFEEPKKLTGTGSTDVAEVSWLIPTSSQLEIAAKPEGAPGHSWAVTSCSGSSIGLKVMLTASKILAATGIEILMDTDIVKKAHKEFEKKTEGFTYKSSVPEGQKPPVP